jgi:UDP-N-acetylmuramyl pentapeptide phosphotransferase/UDP-N-acetylglucosamine-1-phosphate transferase
MNEILNNIMPLILYSTLACFIALILTKLCIITMPLLGMLDMPGGRHIHQKPTPKGGGIAIYLAFFSMTFAYGLLEQPNFIGIRLFFVPATILMLVGYFDDRYDLSAWVKLTGQIGVAVLCWWLGFKINTLLYWHLPEMISLLVTVIWICGFINAFNLIDGLDGLSAGLTVVTTLCMTVWFLFDKNFASASAMLILAGACLGFLRYNFHPAKIFMGDVGSMFIGLTIAVIGMPTSKSITLTAVLVPLLAAGVPIFDVFLAIWRRVVKRLIVKISGDQHRSGGIMAADTNHLHHRVLAKVKDTKQAAISIYLIGVGFAITAIIMMVFRGSAPAIGFIVVLLVFVVLIRRVATIEMWDSASLILEGVKRPTQKMLLILFHPVYDLVVLAFSVYISMLLLFPDKINYNLLMYTIAPVSLFILISKNYRIFWLRADAGDYGYLVQFILLGFVFSFCIDYFFIYVNFNKLFSQSQFSPITCLGGFVLQSFLFTTFLIVGERLALRHLIFVFLNKIYVQNLSESTRIPRTLIYGGGLSCRLLKNNISGNNSTAHNIVGIIDDEMALRGQYIYGTKVCGGFNDLEQICEQYKVEKIILTIDLSDERLEQMKQFSLKYKINITKFSVTEEPLV